MNEMEWSKKEKKIALHAFRSAYERECMYIALDTRKMAERINEPSDLWKLHDFLTKKREETEKKYDYRYSILLSLFARLMYEGCIKEEDLTGLSEDKLQEIHRIVEFFRRK
jgi:hypothetical protein